MAYIPPLKEQLFPILGQNEKLSNWASIDLGNCLSFDLSTHQGLKGCIDSQRKRQGASIGFGGYLEKRTIYQRSDHFTTSEELRNIHLGCDIWGPVGQAVFAPLEGRVHSFAYNDAPFDYGATLIIEHFWPGGKCFALYGHIEKEDISGIEPGDSIAKGLQICHFGDLHENGGWVPHLHFQLIRDIGDFNGDYPGVAPKSRISFYRENCPNPESWLC